MITKFNIFIKENWREQYNAHKADYKAIASAIRDGGLMSYEFGYIIKFYALPEGYDSDDIVRNFKQENYEQIANDIENSVPTSYVNIDIDGKEFEIQWNLELF